MEMTKFHCAGCPNMVMGDRGIWRCSMSGEYIHYEHSENPDEKRIHMGKYITDNFKCPKSGSEGK